MKFAAGVRHIIHDLVIPAFDPNAGRNSCRPHELMTEGYSADFSTPIDIAGVGNRTRGSQRWDRLWEIMTGAMHRTIFALVVGLAALTVSICLWALSLPLVAWKLSQWLSASTFSAHTVSAKNSSPAYCFDWTMQLLF